MNEKDKAFSEKFKEKAESVILEQLEILENGRQLEKEIAIRVMTAVYEMLKVMTLGEVEVLNKQANTIANITGYAVIEKKMTEEELLKELKKIREQRGETEKDAS